MEMVPLYKNHSRSGSPEHGKSGASGSQLSMINGIKQSKYGTGDLWFGGKRSN